MNALDRIANLHSRNDHGHCSGCGDAWPCATRRLCDEAAPTQAEHDAFAEMRDAIADRDRWKADAARLAAALHPIIDADKGYQPWRAGFVLNADAALAAHDALIADTETPT